MASSSKSFVFTAAIRGFHVYRDAWSPEGNVELISLYEERNVFDIFVIKATCRIEDRATVGHLPREITRPIKYFIVRGAMAAQRFRVL